MRNVTITDEKEKSFVQVKDAASWSTVVGVLMPDMKPGTIVALSGPLGAGKTTFVQAFAAVLGVKKQPQSPTFALMRSYPLPKPVNGVTRIIHVDAYRLENEKDLLPLDLDEELADGKSVLLIEWPEKAGEWLTNRPHLLVEIAMA